MHTIKSHKLTEVLIGISVPFLMLFFYLLILDTMDGQSFLEAFALIVFLMISPLIAAFTDFVSLVGLVVLFLSFLLIVSRYRSPWLKLFVGLNFSAWLYLGVWSSAQLY
jgi:hypothetical protein